MEVKIVTDTPQKIMTSQMAQASGFIHGQCFIGDGGFLSRHFVVRKAKTPIHLKFQFYFDRVWDNDYIIIFSYSNVPCQDI